MRSRAELETRWQAIRTRGDLKRAAGELDQDPQLRKQCEAILQEKEDISANIAEWSSKKLLRRLLARDQAAQTVTTPTHRDEAFVCIACGTEVPPHGRTARDHCPICLISCHVDHIPGDRASNCGGRLDPIGLFLRGGDKVIQYRCQRCGIEKVNRAVEDGRVPDDPAKLIALSVAKP